MIFAAIWKAYEKAFQKFIPFVKAIWLETSWNAKHVASLVINGTNFLNSFGFWTSNKTFPLSERDKIIYSFLEQIS